MSLPCLRGSVKDFKTFQVLQPFSTRGVIRRLEYTSLYQLFDCVVFGLLTARMGDFIVK